VSHILHVLGSSVLSQFRQERLLAKFKAQGLPVADITARFEHFVWCEQTPDLATTQRLQQLLDYGPTANVSEPQVSDLILRVIPRLGTISAWASKATDIAHNCGFASVLRIERGIRYVLTPERTWLKTQKLDAAMLAQAADCLHDRRVLLVYS
jgi:phosphoribosylformylglycinamidine synthase